MEKEGNGTMKHFVYYHDGYHGDGCIDLAEFDSQQEALDFINKRAQETGRGVSSYDLIMGRKIPLQVTKYVLKIEVVPGS